MSEECTFIGRKGKIVNVDWRMKRRLWSKTIRGNGCWEFFGSKAYCGYGRVSYFVNGQKIQGHISAHRLSYLLDRGSIPEGLFICHHCDNPRCVRPDHLFAGTPKDNVQDMLRKGRKRRRGGDLSPRKRKSHYKGKPINPPNYKYPRPPRAVQRPPKDPMAHPRDFKRKVMELFRSQPSISYRNASAVLGMCHTTIFYIRKKLLNRTAHALS